MYGGWLVDVLRDAEEKQELSHEAQVWIQELKAAVYDADDLVDEFVSIAEQKQHMDGTEASKRQFGFSVDYHPIRKRREETCSYSYAGSVIGREDDLEKILHTLLDDNFNRMSYLTIVGIGGLGKTALAQLKQLDIEVILGKILASITGQKDERSTLDRVQHHLREKLTSSRYLLVLDDVWTENRSQWLKLAEILVGGHGGSWVVVTTRSQETARIIGHGPMYELQGLSEENSWRLFKRMAFGSHQENHQEDLVKKGREIVKGCARVPLVIRVVGSLLYGQDKSKWSSFSEIGLANINGSENDIMAIMKLSYHHLESPLKSCFSYCALFPKDFEIEKEMLIRLWMAQGYIVPIDEGQSAEDTVKEYFSILLRRCFFQDVQKNEHGEITSCKIHDLMHDLAQNVAGKEICRTHSITVYMDKRVCHLTLMRSTSSKCTFSRACIRSFLQVGLYYQATKIDQLSLKALLTSFMCLRTLDLSNSNIKILPNCIGDIIHLRYLDLSWNVDLSLLLESIAQLHYLETLKLSCCYRLKKLPKDLSNLVKLRVLDMEGCSDLACMPKGMGKLTNLHTLTQFVLGEGGSNKNQLIHDLEGLRALKKLKGCLKIKIQLVENEFKAMEDNRRGGGYLRSKEYLDHIDIRFTDRYEINRRVGYDYEEVLLKDLQPHSNLMVLESGYNGLNMPGWVAFLPNLVRIELIDCGTLQHFSCMRNLHNLKVLDLENLPKDFGYIIYKS
ncbi:putative disease resistance protein RGA1 [Amaranthus tricolor]|uniref:putative disease resistance protein RGA1 n=1 Tax=Amaranthus tricolor TaxID=29722 RepID=UPI00258D9B98|nr:putative disease resistance protein RGA1 [Amaranthus tricolor]